MHSSETNICVEVYMYRKGSQGPAIIPPLKQIYLFAINKIFLKIELWGKDIRCSQRKEILLLHKLYAQSFLITRKSKLKPI